MIRRSRRDIYFDVLEAIYHGISIPTRIRYQTRLSWAMGGSVFDDLLVSDLIMVEKEQHAIRYALTEKGRNALSYYLKALDGLIQSEVLFY